ncbi:GGDEF domain-containing protein [Luteimonas mephitis]|uniref:GGDEF domain-containing protein n=1 Tax=Luteimonas mephitis TaxID=83615 RepID=UPI0003F88DB5|nr:GGDEF domain-containing protein [Luteimonas mephitis]
MDNRNGPSETTQRTLLSDGPHNAPPRSACVVVIHGMGLGSRADVDDGRVLVGRSQDADLCIAHKSVSREHCHIWRDGDDYRIRDLGATNATRVNDVPVAEATLADGDHVTVGESILKFISHTSVEANYHEEIYQLATRDPLTDLCNRRHFIEQMEREIARALRHQRPLTICIIDVDLFKPVNDRYGHISGDEVLRQIADLVHHHARNDDIAARIGGEEFAVLLPECDAGAAYSFAERLRSAVAAATFSPGGEPQRITVSIGIADLSPVRDNRVRLMTAADAALYRAKKEGRNRVCLEP